MTAQDESKKAKQVVPAYTFVNTSGNAIEALGGNVTTETPITVYFTESGPSAVYTTYVGGSTGGTAQSAYPSTAQQQPQPLIDFQARKDIAQLQAGFATLLLHYENDISYVERQLSDVEARISRIGVPFNDQNVLEQLRERLQEITLLQSAYAVATEDGFEVLMIYKDNASLADVLEAVVPFETELDRRFKNTFFDFEHIQESEFLITDYPNAELIMNR